MTTSEVRSSTGRDAHVYEEMARLLEDDHDLRDVLDAFELAREDYLAYMRLLAEPELPRPTNVSDFTLAV